MTVWSGSSATWTAVDGRTYVIAGRYETETDRFFAPEEAVLAAFDDAGRELWRTELDRTPTKVVAVADDVWVLHETGALSWIDASDGRFIDRVFVGDAWSVFAAFGSVWVYALDLGGGSGQLIRPSGHVNHHHRAPSEHHRESRRRPAVLDTAVDAGGIWVLPLGRAGVAVVDVETGQVTGDLVDEIGHEVRQVAVEDDVAYVASSDAVTSIVDGQVGATLPLVETSVSRAGGRRVRRKEFAGIRGAQGGRSDERRGSPTHHRPVGGSRKDRRGGLEVGGAQLQPAPSQVPPRLGRRRMTPEDQVLAGRRARLRRDYKMSPGNAECPVMCALRNHGGWIR